MYRPKQETLLQKSNRTDPFELLNKRKMQKGITPFVILDEDAEAIKKDKLMRKRAKRTIDENLWDSVWLSKLYPSRYYDFYEKWELGNDQFDPALFPDKFVEEDS